VLVAAVLRPEEREDRELEVVRLAPEQLQDARVLAVREAELAVEGLFRDRAQRVSLAAASDGPSRWCPLRCTSHRDGRAAITVTKP
jgi:hypothetical protein